MVLNFLSSFNRKVQSVRLLSEFHTTKCLNVINAGVFKRELNKYLLQ